ncbi:hypothetical protein CV716_04820 [Streptococcus thermophilus]|nr:hypothetical protein CV716_04820 [Streptococcus thermophilus]
MKGIERLISLKRFNVDRMVTVYFNPRQKLKESWDTVTSKNNVVRVNQKISLFQLRMISKTNLKKSGIEITDFFRYLNEIKQVKSE